MPRAPRVPGPQTVLNRLVAALGKHRRKVAIVVGVCAIIAVVVVVAWFLLKGRGRKGGAGPDQPDDATAGVLAEDRPAIADALDHLNGAVIEKTKNHFYSARSMVETTARILNQHSSVRDPFFERYCQDVLKKCRQLDQFYIADADGNRVIVSRSGEPGISMTGDVIDRTGAEPVRIVKRWDEAGNVTSVKTYTTKQLLANPALGGLDKSRTGMYDPRKRPWYRKAVKERTTCWSDVYVFSFNNMPGITVACPATGPGGAPLFVVAADFEIENISRFVAELKVGREGIAFIVNGAGDLVAHPVPKKVLRKRDGKLVFAKAREVVPEWVKTALDAHDQDREDVFTFVHKESTYIASFAPFPESFGTDWTIVVVALEKDLLKAAGGDLNRRPGR
ncbi:MAG: cache domain-containing protein [Planctomycetota bacterium]